MPYYPSYNPVRADGWLGATSYQTNNPDDPGVASPPYWTMWYRWEPVADILSGTQGMRYNHDKYLPRLCNESDKCYQTRINRSVLSPYMHRVIKAAVGLITRKPIQFDGGDEAYWEEWRQNVDRQDTSLDEFMASIIYQAIAYGHCGLLVDYPTNEATNLREEREMEARPYLIPQPCWNILGWRHNVMDAKGDITQVRLREQFLVEEGRYGSEMARQVRVLEPGKYEVWRESEYGSNSYELQESGTVSLSEIPLAVVYSQREGVLMSKPPLEELAHLNIQHYAMQASLINSLHVASFPLLVLQGWDDTSDELQNLSVGNALALPPEGGASYVEPASSAFDAVQEELSSLAEQISTLGITILAKQKNVQESGFSKQMDRAESNSMLAQISLNAEQALQQAINWAAEYAGVEPPTVALDRDFNVEPIEPSALSPLTGLYTNGVIDQETLLRILQRGELLDDSMDLEEIMSGTETEQMESMERELETAEAMSEIEASQAPDEREAGA